MTINCFARISFDHGFVEQHSPDFFPDKNDIYHWSVQTWWLDATLFDFSSRWVFVFIQYIWLGLVSTSAWLFAIKRWLVYFATFFVGFTFLDLFCSWPRSNETHSLAWIAIWRGSQAILRTAWCKRPFFVRAYPWQASMNQFNPTPGVSTRFTYPFARKI